MAVHPEGHRRRRRGRRTCAQQAAKLREADFGLTQFLHRAEDYAAFVEARRRGHARRAGRHADHERAPARADGGDVRAPTCRWSSPWRLHAVADRPDEVRRIGVEHATELCRALLDAGAPGLHFYTMNRAAATLEVCANLGFEPVGSGT